MRQFEIILDQNFVDNSSLMEIALALVHEMIHAEIMERCVQLGIITSATFNPNDWKVSMNFSNGTILSSNLSDVLYAPIIFYYKNFKGNSNWQHEIFDIAGYRQGIANNLSEIHPYLDNYSNPFENNLNTGQIIPLTMEEYFDLISWAGLRSYNENGQILFCDAWQNFVNLIDQQESNILPSQRTYNVYKNITDLGTCLILVFIYFLRKLASLWLFIFTAESQRTQSFTILLKINI